MVEGDLVDLSLPTLLQALARECSTVTVRLQHGGEQGTLYLREGALIHALKGGTTGDEAALEVLAWTDGRFRIVRDGDRQPRTVTGRLTDFLSGNGQQAGSRAGADSFRLPVNANPDEELMTALLTLLTRLEQDRVRLAEGHVEAGPVPALLVLTTIVNSMVAFVTARCTDPNLLPSRLLPRLADTQPYTQLLGEDDERVSIATAAGLLKNWKAGVEDRRQMFQDLCRGLLDMLAFYCNTVNTLFHSTREREEWRTTFDVFVDGLWTAVKQVEA